MHCFNDTARKILICTIVDDWNNYGSRLQAYALCKFINDNFDVECRLCDYRTSSDEAPAFSKFQQQFIPTVYAKSKDDIYEYNPDMILLGSDQILNHNIIDLRSYCFGILNDFSNISTYAAGETGWNPQKNIPNILQKNDKNRFALQLLSRCHYVSVREEVSLKRIKSIIDAPNATFNIDPAFLIRKEDWEKIECKPADVDPNETFDFTYQLINAPKLIQENGVKKYFCVGQTKDKDRYSPQEFLWMVHHCRKLYTGSFHGYAFGIIFNKQIVCTNEENERMRNLKSLLRTNDGYEYVNASIRKQMQISFEYLQNAINSTKILPANLKSCTGCMACAHACEKNAIQETQIDGFKYPKVDVSACAKCSKCINICKAIKQKHEVAALKAFLVTSADQNDAEQSSSGGFVKQLSRYICKNGGVVYGVVFANDFKSCFFSRATRAEEVEFQSKSKYMEACTPDFNQMLADISAGKTVLFVGLPCQTAAVKMICLNAENLMTVSLVCECNASALEWKKYLEHMEEAAGSKAAYVDFRNGIQNELVIMRNGRAFLSKWPENWVYKFCRPNKDSSIVRPSCFECSYKYPNIPGDFIAGDSWGIDKKRHGLREKSGVVFCMSQNAKSMFSKVQSQLKYDELDIKKVLDVFQTKNCAFFRPVEKS